jgi:general stress protein YciG
MNDALFTLTLRRMIMTSYTKDDSKSRKSDENKGSGNQGFASMPKEQVREIAREGGKHSHDNDAKNKTQGHSKPSTSGRERKEDDNTQKNKSSTSRSSSKTKDM